MKHDPFAGLDQRLFENDKPSTTKQRANAATLSRDNARADEGAREPALPRDHEPAPEASIPRMPEPSMERSSVRLRTPASAPTGQRPLVRAIERHSHDVFQDQVRWMNRLKLDLEERYGTKVTGNAMVQLALDLFRDDFERNDEQSNLIRVLVRGKPWRALREGKREGEEG